MDLFSLSGDKKMTVNIPFFPVSRPYRPVGRQILQVDELKPAELARYHREPSVRSHVISARQTTPVCITEAEELCVPLIQIASNPTVSLKQKDNAPYDVEDKAKTKADDSMWRQEDVEVFKVINAAVPHDHIIYTDEKFCLYYLRKALTLLEGHELFGGAIAMHQNMWYKIDDEKHSRFKRRSVSNTRQLDSESAIYGSFYDVPIYVSTMCPKDTVYAVAEKEYVGVMPIQRDHTVLTADDPKKLRIGWVATRTLGFAIINDYATAKVVFGFKPTDEQIAAEKKARQELLQQDREQLQAAEDAAYA